MERRSLLTGPENSTAAAELAYRATELYKKLVLDFAKESIWPVAERAWRRYN
jgi:hypothetical protein